MFLGECVGIVQNHDQRLYCTAIADLRDGDRIDRVGFRHERFQKRLHRPRIAHSAQRLCGKERYHAIPLCEQADQRRERFGAVRNQAFVYGFPPVEQGIKRRIDFVADRLPRDLLHLGDSLRYFRVLYFNIVHFATVGNSAMRMFRKFRSVSGSWPCRLMTPAVVRAPLRALN